MDRTVIVNRVRTRIRGPLDASVWLDLLAEGWVDDVLDAYKLAKGTGDRELADLVSEYRARAGSAVSTTSTVGPDARAVALAEIIRAEVGRRPDVVGFRYYALGGELLPPGEVDAWLTGDAALRVTVRRLGDDPPFPQGLLRGARPFLEVLARRVADRYPALDVGDARTLILTGQCPPLFRARVVARRSASPAAAMVMMTVSARMSPREVARLYADARAAALGRSRARTRGLEDDALTSRLAVFAAEANDGRTWREACDGWNAAEPDRPYSDWKRFATDARSAYARLTGARLEWRRSGGAAG